MLDVGDELAGGNAVAPRVVPTTGGIVLHPVEPGTGTAARAWIPATEVGQAAVAGGTRGVAGWALSFGTPAVMHPHPRRFRSTHAGPLIALFREWAEDAPCLRPAEPAGTHRTG